MRFKESGRFYGSAVLAGALLMAVRLPGQVTAPRPRVVIGPADAGVLIPSVNAKRGEKSDSAMAVLNAAAASLSALEKYDIECKGMLYRGGSSNAEPVPVTFVIAGNGSFRMIISEKNGVHEVRSSGNLKVAKRADGGMTPEEKSEFGEAMAIPYSLGSITRRVDLAAADQGDRVVEGQPSRAVALTLFSNGNGTQETASLFFLKETPQLAKFVRVRKSLGYRPTESLEIVTYRDYRPVDSVIAPFEFEFSEDGQVISTLRVSSASLIARNDDSYFRFE